MQVSFTYRDFDGEVKASTAEVFEERFGDETWFWAVNLTTFGYGKRVSSLAHWDPIPEALRQLMGGREITTWSPQ